MNELHVAARDGSVERTLAVLASDGVVDIDEGTTPDGVTPLMIACLVGHLRIVRILVSKGANLAIVDGKGVAALHQSAQNGHLAVTRLLVKAGSDPDTKTARGSTPLHLAAQEGHVEVIRVLIEARANLNSRGLNGSTPLYMAASYGHVDAVKLLLRAKANPLLTFSNSGFVCVPLDVTAERGHLEIARELIQEHGIEGCGGVTGGVQALRLAAQYQHVEIMDLLTSAGVVDPGIALLNSATFGRKSSVKFLLQQQEWRASGEGAAYLMNTCDTSGKTPLLCSVTGCHPCSPRITRMLVDAGVDITAAVRVTDAEGRVTFNDTPLALVDRYLSAKKIEKKDVTESQLHSLEATRRLLMRVEAVHAVSWLWASDVPSVTHATAQATGKSHATPTPLTSTLRILRLRAGRPRVLLAALSRHSGKPY